MNGSRKLSLALALALLATALLVPALLLPTAGLAAAENPTADEPGTACAGAALSPDVPHEVARPTRTQEDFDCFSWQSLVALNWAAGAENGKPDRSRPFGQTGRDGHVVWTTYKQPGEVFLPAGRNPCPCDTSDPACRERCWNARQEIPAVCRNLQGQANLVLTNTSKVGTFADSQNQAAPNVWLTDQNGNLVRYEVRMNRDVFDFIAKNRYYDGARQWGNPNASFEMAAGQNGGPEGPINVKAAWKIVRPEERHRFFYREALIVDLRVDPLTGFARPDGQYMTCNRPGEGPCCIRPVGLVGFHIAHKTRGLPQWAWSTFEHVDNAPTAGVPRPPGKRYSFYDPDCRDCVPNQNPRTAKIPVAKPVQVERIVQIDRRSKRPVPILPEAVNRRWQGLVGGTVWKNYVLVSTQWPRDPDRNDFPRTRRKNGIPEPSYLANTTLETYTQTHENRFTVSSCIDCHLFASGLNGKQADFTYFFSKAEPRKPVASH